MESASSEADFKVEIDLVPAEEAGAGRQTLINVRHESNSSWQPGFSDNPGHTTVHGFFHRSSKYPFTFTSSVSPRWITA